jgi:hypothetical protein
MTRSVLTILFVASFAATAYSYNPSASTTTSRRNFVNGLVGAATTVAMVAGMEPANAVISSRYCAYGQGEGCEDLAEGNAFIRQLQEKSSANKETIQSVRSINTHAVISRTTSNSHHDCSSYLLKCSLQEARNAYYMKNYPDWFAAVGKNMVKKADGTFILLTPQELADLKKENKITLEYPMAMGGRVADVTQKPIMVLRE